MCSYAAMKALLIVPDGALRLPGLAILKHGGEMLAGAFAAFGRKERGPDGARCHAQSEVAAELPPSFHAFARFGGSGGYSLADLRQTGLSLADGLGGCAS